MDSIIAQGLHATRGGKAGSANPSSCEKTQEFDGADDPDSAKLFQLQQVLISADDVLRMALKSAFDDHVIFGVAADRRQRLGNLNHLQKAQRARQRGAARFRLGSARTPAP
jgi:hypothetical protein